MRNNRVECPLVRQKGFQHFQPRAASNRRRGEVGAWFAGGRQRHGFLNGTPCTVLLRCTTGGANISGKLIPLLVNPLRIEILEGG